MPDATRKVMNIGPSIVSANLDTMAAGRRESVHLRPREVVELSAEKFASAEIQRLITSHIVVDMTRTEERRLQRDAELKGK